MEELQTLRSDMWRSTRQYLYGATSVGTSHWGNEEPELMAVCRARPQLKILDVSKLGRRKINRSPDFLVHFGRFEE